MSNTAPMRWPPGKDRNLETATLRWPPDEQALEITLLRFVNAKMNLGNRAGKDERHRRGETNDRQFQRRDKIDKSYAASLLESDRLEKFHEIRLLLFHHSLGSS